MRYLKIAALAASLLLAFTAPIASAAPVLPVEVSAVVATAPTYDMMGTYSAPELRAVVVVSADGHAGIGWDNDYGRHYAFYEATQRIPGGGFMAIGTRAEDGYPNGSRMIAIKPAERGFIQLVTFDPDTREISGVYRMYKTR
jgi:hypothetical protein